MKDDERFEDILRRAMEEETKEDYGGDTDGDISPEQAEKIMGILKMSSMMELGKAAKDKILDIIRRLAAELDEHNVSNETLSLYQAYASRAIEKAAKEISVLKAIVSASVLTSLDTMDNKEKDINKTLDLILRVNRL